MKKRLISCSLVLTATLLFSTSAMALDQGRILACLYAHQDKISARCDYALYDAAAQLQRVIAGLTYVAGECRDDLQSYCADV